MKKVFKTVLLVMLFVVLSVSVFGQEIQAASKKLSKPKITVSNVKASGKIKIKWKAVKNAKSYKVYRSTDGKKWNKLTTTKKTSVVNTSVTVGKKYYYKVKAIAPEGMKNSSYSDVKYKVCDLKRPEIKTSADKATGKPVIKWEKIDKAKSYKVYYSTDNEEWELLKSVTGTKFTHTSAKAEKKYYYKVKAIASKSSANSAYSSVKYRRCDLKRPEIKLSSDEETGKTIIKWGKIDKAKSYKIYYSTDNKEWELLKSVTGTKFTHTSAKSGKKYYYKVKAIASKSSADSAYSSVKSRTYKAPEKENQQEEVTDYQNEVANLAVEIATEWKTAYRSGKTGQKDSNGVYGFDCSGFATYVINTVMQKDIPTFRLTANISKFCNMEAVYNEGYPGEFKAKTVSFKNIQPGDVIFFSHSSTNDHCGIYVGDNKVVHCSNSKGGVVMNEITGYLERDLSIVRRYIPEKVTMANTKKTIAKGCSLYSKRADDDSKMSSLKKGSTVTVLFTGNSPDSYNQAYVKTADGKKGFVYTKNLE